jgi:hypothetical protein
MAEILAAAGLAEVEWISLAFGTVTLAPDGDH